ncbi:hypothetical protein KCU81_g4320, partial [Aureobasidium melanogenum]|uniref:Uncharacterized protein n=1 Tax=Aureobasidium melanogenum (strain CBS 110374) TaxID=1043003 RepID=A0A074VQE1_AURM1
MKFTATLLTFLGATSWVAAAPLDISQPMPGPEGLVKRQHPVTFKCRQADTRCSWKSALCWDTAERCYQKCMKEEGCYSPIWPPPPVIETKEKRNSQDHCGLRNFQCESQAEFANPGTNITEIYHNCMEESGCEPAPTHNNLTTEHLTKRWHPHCGAWQSFKCNAKAKKPSRWGDPDADVKKEYRACMIENKCRCAIEYPYYCNKDNS